MTAPINIPGGNAASALSGPGGGQSSISVTPRTGGDGNGSGDGNPLGIFGQLLDLVAGLQGGGDADGSETLLHKSGNLLNVKLGDLEARFQSADFDKLDKQSPLANLIGQLTGLLKDLAGKLQDGGGNGVTGAASKALKLAQALLDRLGQGGQGTNDTALLQTGKAGPSPTDLAQQLRSMASQLDLAKSGINTPSAQAQTDAVFNGQAPGLDDLLQPGGKDKKTADGLPRADGSGNSSRLADTLGAKFAASTQGDAGTTAQTQAQTQAQANAAASNHAANTLAAALATKSGPADSPASGSSGTDPLLASQISGATHQAQTNPAAAVKAVQAAYQGPQIDLPQVAVAITRQFQAGNNRFQIRLDPPELGRIDVRMDVDPHGAVRAHLAVDRPETLDMLQRDARGLERALNQAGLDSSKTNLEFSLRQNPFANGQHGQQGQPGDGQWPGNPSSGLAADAEASEHIPQAAISAAYRGFASPGGVNLWV